MRRICLLLIAIWTSPVSAVQAPSSPDVLLEAAMQREQVDGDLAGAVAAYTEIVEKFPASAAVASRALEQLAGIYERLAQQDRAREAYRRILADYPGSGAPAVAARQRLRTLTPARFSQVQVPVPDNAVGALGSVSPDGRFVSWGDLILPTLGGTGNLMVWEVASGRVSTVTRFSNTNAPYSDGRAEFSSVWSPDGTRLAYGWLKPDGLADLRIVALGSGRHTILYEPKEPRTIRPLAWSPDGRHIAAGISVSAGEGTVGETQLVLVSTGDASLKLVRTLEGGLERAFFSPDGRYLAYDFQRSNDAPARDVVVRALETGVETPVAADVSTHDIVLGWTSGGHLIYGSDGSGRPDVWTVLIGNGSPEGRPRLVQRNIDQLRPLGLTGDGRLFVEKSVIEVDVYVADLDPVTGKAVRPAAPLIRAQPALYRHEPAWSPDGARIAYVQSGPGIPESIVVQTMATGAVRVYQPHVRNIDHPLWTPDSRGFVFDGTGEDNVQRAYRLDLESARVEAISDGLVFGISPDGTSFYEGGPNRVFTRRSFDDSSADVVGSVQEASLGNTVLSPDGRWFAYLANVRTGQGRSLAIRPAAGGPERVLVDRFRGGYPRVAWTPDSSHIIVQINPGGLYRVSIEDGARESLGIPAGGGAGQILERSMNADGTRLAFAVSRTRRELWVWEHLLSEIR